MTSSPSLSTTTEAAPGEQQLVGAEGAKALEFLVSASPDKKRLCPLTELAAQPSEAAVSGFSKVHTCLGVCSGGEVV